MRLINSFIMACLAVAVLALFPPLHSAQAITTTDFSRKVEIKIQPSYIDATLTDFPVLITEDNVPSEVCDADGSYPAQEGGGDIRFTSDEAGVTEIPLQVIKFDIDNNPANCIIEMWTKVPTVSSGATTSFWMWYNTASADTQAGSGTTYGSQNVWDSSYKGIWHMQETIGDAIDETSNTNNLTNQNVAFGSGKIGNGADFEKTGSTYMSITDTAQSGLDFSSDITFSSWIKFESHDDWTTFIHKYNATGNQRAYYLLRKPDDYNVQLGISTDGTALAKANTAWRPTDGQWYHVATVYDASTGEAKHFIDGTQSGSTTTSMPSSVHTNSEPFYLGAFGGASDYMDGFMDEVRISSVARSDAWIKAEYSTVNIPSSFAVNQTPQDATVSGGAGTGVVLIDSIRKSADQSIPNSTTLQDDSQLSLTINANKSYVVNGAIFATSTNATPDLKFGFIATGATLDIGYVSHNIDGSPTIRAGLLETSGGASEQIPIKANSVAIIQIFGTVKAGTSTGSLALQWSQFQSHATATVVKEGSFLSITDSEEGQ